MNNWVWAYLIICWVVGYISTCILIHFSIEDQDRSGLIVGWVLIGWGWLIFPFITFPFTGCCIINTYENYLNNKEYVTEGMSESDLKDWVKNK